MILLIKNRTKTNMIREKITAHLEARDLRHQEAQADYDANTRTPDELVTDDKEILGTKAGSFLRNRYRHQADRLSEQIETAEANKDIPGMREKYIKYRDNRATIQSARIQRKIDNSSNSFLSTQINHQRRYKLKQLQYAKKVYADRSGALESKRVNKPEKLQKKVDELIRKKVDAMYRKAQREALRQNDIGRHNIMKKAEFVAKMTPEMKKKIATEAVLLVRKRNIEKGHLDPSHTVDTSLTKRKVTNEYGRTIE
jgi:hypothetical protein